MSTLNQRTQDAFPKKSERKWGQALTKEPGTLPKLGVTFSRHGFDGTQARPGAVFLSLHSIEAVCLHPEDSAFNHSVFTQDPRESALATLVLNEKKVVC